MAAETETWAKVMQAANISGNNLVVQHYHNDWRAVAWTAAGVTSSSLVARRLPIASSIADTIAPPTTPHAAFAGTLGAERIGGVGASWGNSTSDSGVSCSHSTRLINEGPQQRLTMFARKPNSSYSAPPVPAPSRRRSGPSPASD